ncbi:hypothetical protein AGOR_G00135020 [Albula goreensis]|uniref:Coiled-coil domain-containing protein 27 n=1 Tax=Albula goreensis TaxID=1534307 RepID=A0A8T3DCF0_9TELE|nr:hypothetical protein AGOR_G00135020 [Albula goreensis]
MEQPGPQCTHATVLSTQEDRQSAHFEMQLEAPQYNAENTVNLVSLVEHTREQDNYDRINKTLTKDLEETKNNLKMSSGAVCSLKRALSAKEGELATSRYQVDELKQELKDRMAQLQAMSRKFSCLREGKANEEVIATLETENDTLRQLTAQLKEELSQKDHQAAHNMDEVQKLQHDLALERASQAELRRQGQANQSITASLHLQLSKSKVSLEQVQSRYERLRVKILQAVYTAPGVKQPLNEISDTELLQTMQNIIDDRTTFHQRLQQKGEKMPPLTTVEVPGAKTTYTSLKRN